MADEEKKGPSKKELKKLAKKAEKEAAKNAGTTAVEAAVGAAPVATVGVPSPANETTATGTGGTTTYYLAHGSSEDLSTQKASVAAQLFGVALQAAPADLNIASAIPFVRGPALLSSTQEPIVAAFGGNACLKALASLGTSTASATTTAVVGDAFVQALIDDALEWERTTLRPSLQTPKKLKAALTSLQTKLNGQIHLVHDHDATTVADISVVVTLVHSKVDLTPFPTVQTFVDTHLATPCFQAGLSHGALEQLVPPKPFDFDTNPYMMKAVMSVFETAMAKIVPEGVELPTTNGLIARCSNPKHGDYQCNAAMPLFGKLKGQFKSPQQVAKAIQDAIPESNPVLDQLTINGPGFLLCKIKASYLQTFMNQLLKEGGPPKPPLPKPELKQCVVDFSSPNIAKEMHVGHLRSTIIGEAVCRILEFSGHEVARVNHVGDWGTQFGMLIQYLTEEYPTYGSDDDKKNNSITDLTQFYKSAKERFDVSPEFKKLSQQNVVKLQGGDETSLRMWKLLCDVSRGEFKKVYDRLDISVEECGESFYNEKIPPVIQEFKDAGLIRIEEGGAKCVFLDNYKVPLMLQKSDGGFGYDSTDMAALKYRIQTIGAKRIIVITDFSQGDHFKMCNLAAKKIGWATDDVKLQHIGFGTVQGEDGKRFKTRSGDTVRLVDLLDEAVSRMATSLEERIVEGRANITKDEVAATAAAMGYGAVKYFDLRRNPTTNYVFSYDRMLDTKGNTAIYLLYANARLESICTKAKAAHNVDVEELIRDGTAQIVLGHASEVNLAFFLNQFADMMEVTLEDLYPYHIGDFLYNVSNAASEFVTQCKVLGSPEMNSRLLLCRATTVVMRQCFDLLGIRHVNKI
eukprot:scaffold29664_cov51-Attheya_sp.AAC.3